MLLGHLLLPSIEARGDLFLSLCSHRAHVLSKNAHGVGQCDFLVTVRPCDTFQIRTWKQFFGNFNFWFTYYLCHQKTSPLLHTYIYDWTQSISLYIYCIENEICGFPEGLHISAKLPMLNAGYNANLKIYNFRCKVFDKI